MTKEIEEMATQSFKKWVKATAVALALAVPSLSQAAYYNSCDPCNPCGNPCDPCASFCDMDFTIGADFLWWKPCVDELEYATIDVPAVPVTTVASQYAAVCPKWEPGFRVYLGVPGLCYDFDLTASYTWIYSGTTATAVAVAPAGIGGFRLHPALAAFATDEYLGASSSYRLHYNEWDVLFSYRVACNPCHVFVPHFGIAGIVTSSTQSGFYTALADLVLDPDTDAAWTSEADYWGVGLRVGSDYEYKFSRCLKVFARAQGTILAGEAKSNYAAFGPTETAAIDTILIGEDNHCCAIVPGYHLAVGFQYDDKMCDMDVFFRIGYEFLNWWNMPNVRQFISSDTTNGLGSATPASIRTLGFQGLFVGGGVSF